MRDILELIININKFIKKDYNTSATDIHKFIDESKLYHDLSDEDKILMDYIKLVIQSSKTSEYRPASP
jgi:hypothetical protein